MVAVVKYKKLLALKATIQNYFGLLDSIIQTNVPSLLLNIKAPDKH